MNVFQHLSREELTLNRHGLGNYTISTIADLLPTLPAEAHAPSSSSVRTEVGGLNRKFRRGLFQSSCEQMRGIPTLGQLLRRRTFSSASITSAEEPSTGIASRSSTGFASPGRLNWFSPCRHRAAETGTTSCPARDVFTLSKSLFGSDKGLASLHPSRSGLCFHCTQTFSVLVLFDTHTKGISTDSGHGFCSRSLRSCGVHWRNRQHSRRLRRLQVQPRGGLENWVPYNFSLVRSSVVPGPGYRCCAAAERDLVSQTKTCR